VLLRGVLLDSVVVLLAAMIGLHVDAKTSGGRMTTELPVTVQGALRIILQTKMNAGGSKLLLWTSDRGMRMGTLQ